MPPFRTHVPGPAPAGGGALNVSGSQASIKFTMTLPDAFIRWLTVVASASVGFAVMPEGVVSVNGVLDGLPGPQPNRSSTNATRTERKGISSAPFGAAARKRVAVLGQQVHSGFRSGRLQTVARRFSILELNGESRIQLSLVVAAEDY